MAKHIILITALLLGSTKFLFAQNLKGANTIDAIHKPNALKNGSGTNTVDVDLYTGTASISIPIYSNAVAGLDLGITLDYLAKGIKVNQLSSSVGLGWELNYGGTITRQVAGLEDEVTLPTTFASTSDSLQGRLVPGANRTEGDPMMDDADPDVFTANFGGRSVEFSFVKNYLGTVVECQTRPHSSIHIYPITEDVSGSGYTNVRSGFGSKCGLDSLHDLLGFTIVDELGNTFTFHRGDYRRKRFGFPDSTVIYPDSGIYYPIETWNLTKVVTYTGFTIQYDYYKKWANYLENVTETVYPRLDVDPTVDPDPVEIKSHYYTGIKTHIKRITYPHGVTVDFDLDSSINGRCDNRTDYRLKNIIVKTNDVNPITFRLNQAYFNTMDRGLNSIEYAVPSACSTLVSSMVTTGYNADSMKSAHLDRGTRLKLKSIDKVGPDGSTYENYFTFTYNTTPLPDRFTSKQDYYGYYNGKASYMYVRGYFRAGVIDTFYLSIPYHHQVGGPGYLLPTYTDTSIHDWGQDRSYDMNKAQAFSLQTIRNCSGGQDSLVYQDYHLTNPSCSYSRSFTYANGKIDHLVVPPIYKGCSDIDTALQGDTCNDGLCIGKIISRDGYSYQNTTTTEYTYEDGQRFNRGGYMWYTDTATYSLGNNDPNNCLVVCNYFLNSHEYFHNSNHGFGKVTVTTKGYLGQQQSKMTAWFTNLMFKDASGNDTSCMTAITGEQFHTMPPSLLKYRLGLPIKTETYDKSGVLTSREETSYNYYTDGDPITGVKEFNTLLTYFHFNYRGFDNEWLIPYKVNDTTYIGGNKMPEVHTYTYDGAFNLTSDTWTDSKGDTFATEIKYAGNYGYSRTFPQNAANPLSTISWKVSAAGNQLLGRTLVVTDSVNGFIRFPAKFSTIQTSPLSYANYLDTTKINDKAAFNYNYRNDYGTNFIKVSEVTRYDAGNNPVEIKLNNQDQYIANIYDSSNGWLLAKAVNAMYDDIAYSSFESDDFHTTAESNGNWIFWSTGTDASGSMTGTKAYYLSGDEIDSKTLHDGVKYVLSFWTKYTMSAIPAVNLIGGHGYTPVTMTLQNTVNGWEYYTAIVSPARGEHLSITGQGASTIPPSPETYIDELRLCPLEASMSTYTYAPNIGMTSSANNSGYINYYEYDAMGRPTIVRDLRGNIIKAVTASCSSPWNTSYDNGPVPCDNCNPNQ